MIHHTKHKGDLGVLKAQVDLYNQGYMILTPQTEHAPFDLVAYSEKKFIRVQVKYRELNKNGVLEIRFRSSYSDSKNVHCKPVDKNEIDLYCVYCPQTDECYYFSPAYFGNSINLRIEEPKNCQSIGVHMAKDFRFINNMNLNI